MKLSIWAYVGIALALVLLGEGAWIHILRSDNAAYKVAVSGYKSAQATNLKSIATLQQKNADIIALWVADKGQSEAAAARAAKAESALSDALANRKTTRTTIYEHNPDAKAWAATVVPAAIADSLR